MPRVSTEEFMAARLREAERRRLLRPQSAGQVVDAGRSILRSQAGAIFAESAGPMAIGYVGLAFLATFALPTLFRPGGEEVRAEATEALLITSVSLLLALPLIAWGIGRTVWISIRHASQMILPWSWSQTLSAKSSSSLMAWLFVRNLSLLLAPLALIALSGPLEATGNAAAGAVISSLGVFSIIVAVVIVPFISGGDTLAPCSAAFEKLGPFASVRRSRALLGQKRFHGDGTAAVILIWLVVVFIWLILLVGFRSLSSLLDVPAALKGWFSQPALADIAIGVWKSLPWLLSVWISTIYWSVSGCVLYIDRRSRLEAFDIEALAAVEGIERA